jgi:N6-L-threonylcarbamoyladenine synthase/protein kinase Bud32
MIAVLGAAMYDAGDTVSIEDSSVRPDFRPDEVEVTWRSEGTVARSDPNDERPQGAEAIVELEADEGRAYKRRHSKAYRHPALDRRLRRQRTRSEARLTSDARRLGVSTPVVFDIDPPSGLLEFEFVGEADLSESITTARIRTVGRHLAHCHEAGFVHGDPTPRNVRVSSDRTWLIDFGLGYYTDDVEDYAMDLHVFEGALGGTAATPAELIAAFEDAYRDAGDERVLRRLRDIERRGRYQ